MAQKLTPFSFRLNDGDNQIHGCCTAKNRKAAKRYIIAEMGSDIDIVSVEQDRTLDFDNYNKPQFILS